MVSYTHVQFLHDNSHKVVPKWIKDVYGNKLMNVDGIEVIGQRWSIVYDADQGSLNNLRGLLELFRVVTNETIIFTMNASKNISARIYQVDGKEIDYVSRMVGNPASKCSGWMWRVICDEDGM